MTAKKAGSLAPSVTARDPQGLKFMSIVEAAYNKARLSPGEEAQRVNDAPGLATLVGAFIAENRSNNRFKDEEARSSLGYPKEYKGPKPIAKQIQALAAILDLDPVSALEYTKSLPELPQGAEGWFAVPSIDALARKHFEVSDSGEKYCRAIQVVLDKIAASRSFRNWRNGQITQDRIRLSARTASALAELAETQKRSDILIVAAQLGMRHRGRSARRAREVFVANEFGLGSVIGGSIALTHPERFVRFEELDMDLAGDEFDDPDSDDRFDHAPSLSWRDDRVRFVTRWYGRAYDFYGSASGFLPQK